jgi:hypothetical protein
MGWVVGWTYLAQREGKVMGLTYTVMKLLVISRLTDETYWLLTKNSAPQR